MTVHDSLTAQLLSIKDCLLEDFYSRDGVQFTAIEMVSSVSCSNRLKLNIENGKTFRAGLLFKKSAKN